ncbi:BrnT family toxin [Rhodanobacter sp. B05]|uniref:BrnT family toxin n=1 Tax=Rhodanobacter sp. B05 TaxID=1945859 RepID=UPI001C2BBD13|nr:BrnT family toxin [Rhodanobacter sp. B05]
MHHEADPAKADANLAKHGVAFDEAATCLLDPMALVMEDEAPDEVRCVLVGTSERGAC